MEANEMQEFSKQMKEAGGEESLMQISLAISILAVLVALITVLGHRSHTEAVLMQGRATDQWNEYQAKKIREDNLSVVIDTLGLSVPASTARDTMIGEYKVHVAKWKAELSQQQEKAQEYEAEVAHAEKQAARFDVGEALLQIGVVLCSVTLFSRKRSYFFFGLTLGAVGLLTGATAFFIR